MRALLFILCLCLMAFSATSAEKNYQVFELGFNPESKTQLIQGMLSPTGKLYNIRPGSVFVRDQPEVLKAIEDILKNPDLDHVDQVQVTLRRKDSGNGENNHRAISGEMNNKDWKLNGSLGQNSAQSLKNNSQNIMAIIGEKAYLSLSTTATQLQVFRRRFLQVVNVQEELEALQVLVEKSGAHYRVKLLSVYRARVDGRWKTFETGSINTTVECLAGQWLNVGGTTQSNSASQGSMWGLNRDSNEGSRLLDLELSVEPVKLLKH